MQNQRPGMPRYGLSPLRCVPLLDNPADIVRIAAVSRKWRDFVIRHGLCKKLFMKMYPRLKHVAHESNGRYQIIRLSDVVIARDDDKLKVLEREHSVYSHLLQPLSRRIDAPRDCLLFPVGTSSIGENILTATDPIYSYPVGFSPLSSEGQCERHVDCLKYLDQDICVHILNLLDDPADLVRFSAVSSFWYEFVISNGVAKHLCLKILPQLSKISCIVVGNWEDEAETSTSIKSDHRVYASLLYAAQKLKVFREDCIEYAISASSTNSFPDESILNTLHIDRIFGQPSYWASKGHNNPQVPETLVYKLRPGFWVITEVDVQPFQAFWQDQRPTYSAGSVRFRIGHPRSRNEISNNPESFPLPNGVDDKFVWTYTSPVFPMTQDNTLQPFELPEPVLCLDGYLQVELLDRIQRQASNGLFYIRVNHVKVVGRPLFPAFDVEVEETSGEMRLTYYPAFFGNIMVWPSESDPEVMFLLQNDPSLFNVRNLMLGRQLPF